MRILIADDDDATRKGLQAFLIASGHTITEAQDGEEALGKLDSGPFDLVLSDVKMPRIDGLGLLAALKERVPDLPVIMMTAFATVEEAVKALQNGATDYLTKPLNLNELTIRLDRLAERVSLQNENQSLKMRLRQYEFPEMIGVSAAIRDVQTAIKRLSSDSDVPVMIYGESGTGKELAARIIHDLSDRQERPFIAVNCAAFQDTLLESELFGHKKGAFTGAIHDKDGFFQAADGGALFLDEVGEMSPRMQSKLLRVIQDQQVQPVGSTRSAPVDVRLIGASNQDLSKLIREKRFREDLYYRLNVVEIRLPALRDRRDDIPLLLQHFLDKYRGRRSQVSVFSKEAMRILQSYGWPGNIRELENCVRMLLATCPSDLIEADDLPEKCGRSQLSAQTDFSETRDYKIALEKIVEQFERGFLSVHLKRNRGNVSKTADSIGISRVALHQKIRKYGLTDPQ